MIKTLVRIGLVFTALLISNNLASGTTTGFDGGNPTPCSPQGCPTPQPPM